MCTLTESLTVLQHTGLLQFPVMIYTLQEGKPSLQKSGNYTVVQFSPSFTKSFCLVEIYTCTIITLLHFTLSFSVVPSLPKGKLDPPPLTVCLGHSVNFVSLPWLPQRSCGSQDVEVRLSPAARCPGAAQSSSSSSFFQPLKASH